MGEASGAAERPRAWLAEPAGGEPLRGVVPGARFTALPGIERVRAWASGAAQLPPLCHLTGARVSQVEPGGVALALPSSPWLRNGLDIHVTMDLLSALASELAGLTVVPAGSRARLVALNAQAMRMAREADGPFTARSSVVRTGRTFVRVATTVLDAGGRMVGQAIGTLAMDAVHSGVQSSPGAASLPHYEGPDPPERPPPSRQLDMSVWDERPPLQTFQRMGSGELPLPNLNRLTGLTHLDVAEGSATLSVPASSWLSLQDDTVDPAIINTLAAFLSGAAALSTGVAGRTGGELNRAMAFERPIPTDGRDIVMRASTRLRGANLMVCEVEVTDADGNIAALEQSVWLLVRLRREARAADGGQRTLATVLFTDIVASTERAVALGDTAWRELLGAHQEIVRSQLEIFRGHEVKTTGDGFLATFDSPARAVQCARAIRDRLQPRGLQIRAALHTGELERTGGDIAGIAVHIASRILTTCAANEILVSSTVRDLATGSGLRLEDRGLHALKGLEEEWRLFAVRD